MDVSKLYPKIDFPVSRGNLRSFNYSLSNESREFSRIIFFFPLQGTPMISPLIKWDHAENFFHMKHEERLLKGEQHFPVTLADTDYEFISGHTIDGERKNC